MFERYNYFNEVHKAAENYIRTNYPDADYTQMYDEIFENCESATEVTGSATGVYCEDYQTNINCIMSNPQLLEEVLQVNGCENKTVIELLEDPFTIDCMIRQAVLSQVFDEAIAAASKE